MSLRLLFPLLVAPDKWNSTLITMEMWGARWAWYQALRFLFLWAALYVISVAFGVATMAVTAALMGLTLRADYWSNCVEFLAASLACAAGVMSVSWMSGLLWGLILGLGRETIPFLALLGGAYPIAMAIGAGISQMTLRGLHRPQKCNEPAERALQYGKLQAKWNLGLLLSGRAGPLLEVVPYILIAALAMITAPVLALGVVTATFLFARINEPRVLTLLVPFAARTLCGT